ncbi:hypothetical protein OUZ56_008287 [Daphnia magna]|uniref:Uncharacterized protein n=1 Tax=Daphnia magna TaxID=35525 RepID=A0ABR0ACI3_9CRUS|nr:hypothetical protein OUZ56_008287 [Daphnia magna]
MKHIYYVHSVDVTYAIRSEKSPDGPSSTPPGEPKVIGNVERMGHITREGQTNDADGVNVLLGKHADE